MKHVHAHCLRCLVCGEDVPPDDEGEDFDSAIVVTVEIGSASFASTYDGVLAVCEDCQEVALADVELLNVRALGRALMLAAECAATKRSKRESQAQAAGREAGRPMRPRRPH